jgi:tryptophan synthase alpha chain
MSRISELFSCIDHKALIGYLTVGYPDVETTLKAAEALAESGCDIIELGIPFSDPLADGTTIQAASYAALQNGVTPLVCLEVARQLSSRIKTPLVFMTYINPVMHFGVERFICESRDAGVAGLIVPDLPPDEGSQLKAVADSQGLDTIFLLAPNSTDERVSLVSRNSRGFIYLVSLTGVTGSSGTPSAGLDEFIRRVRSMTSLPLCVGFGVSSVERARRAAHMTDGVIIGSRLIQLVEQDRSLRALRDFLVEIKGAIDVEIPPG